MYRNKTSAPEQRIYTEVECPVDMDRLCRLCAEPCTAATSISLRKCSQALVSQLLLYFGVLIGENDGLPTKLCMSCKKELDRWEEIKGMVQRGQTYLMQQLALKRERDQSEQPDEFEIIDIEPESPLEIRIEEIFDEPSYPGDDMTVYDVDQSPGSPSNDHNDSSNDHNDASNDHNDAFNDHDDASNDQDTSQSENPSEYYRCNICSVTISSKSRFYNHMQINHPGSHKNLKKKKAETLMNVYNRLKRPVTPTNPFKCGLCPDEFKRSAQLEAHVEHHSTTNKFVKRYPCAHCNVLFKQVKLLMEHQKQHIQNPTKVLAATCEVCNKGFSKRENLKTHMLSHKEEFNFTCTECPAKFKYNNLLKEHIGKCHRGVPPTPITPTSMETRSKQGQMAKKSSKTADKTCMDPLELETSQSNEQHEDIKIQDYEIGIGKCGLCEMVFMNISDLTKHLLNIHKPNASQYLVFTCGNCCDIFETIDELIAHVQIHSTSSDSPVSDTSDIKYICKFCDPPVQLNYLLGVEYHMRRKHPDVKYKKELQKSGRSSKKPYLEMIKQESEDSMFVSDVTYDDHSSSEDESIEMLVVNLVEDAPPDMTKLFHCSICGADCEGLDLYLSHMSQEMDRRSSVPCGICNIKFKKLESLSLHIQKHAENSHEHIHVACDFCGKKFDDEGKLLAHHGSHSNHKRYQCFACNRGYKLKNAYVHHFRAVHTDFQGEPNDLLVDIPEAIGTQADGIIVNPETWAYILKHREKLKTVRNYGCGVCGARFELESEFVSHISAEFDKLKRKNLPCYICGSSFRKVEPLLKHTKKHISNPDKEINHKCNICGKNFHARVHYNQHLHTHTGLKRFKCNLCDMPFSFKSSWKDHLKTKHPDFDGDETTGLIIAPPKSNDTYNSQMPSQNLQVIQINPDDLDIDATDVDQINKLIDIAFVDELEKANQDEVTNELKILETDPHYKCDICNEKFVSSKLSFEHTLEKHVNPTELVCPCCQEEHTSQNEFHNHIFSQHSKIRRFFCHICGKDFSNAGAVKIHLNVHSSVRSFQCEQCPCSYRNHSALWQHRRRVHLKDYNVMCELCSKLFLTKAELRKHMVRRHEGGAPKPYECNVCNATFELPSKLKIHMNRHTGNLPLRCVKCNAGFVDLKYWRLHMRQKCKVPEEDIPYTRPRFEN